MADEQQKTAAVVDGERPLTDKELEAMLRKSEKVTEFPEVTFDEFTEPTWDEWVEACNALLKGKPLTRSCIPKTTRALPLTRFILVKALMQFCRPTIILVWAISCVAQLLTVMYTSLWGIAQACDETLPAENNELLKEEISKGSTVYNIKLDTATKNGVDVKDAEKPGDIGVNVTTVEDMSVLLNGLKLDKYPIMMYTGAGAKPAGSDCCRSEGRWS